jgi:hypothetical protein
LKITTNANVMVEQFCKSILQLEIKRSKSLANLVMGLSSQTHAKSVVEISLSPCYHYQFSSISKTIDALFKELSLSDSEQEDIATERKDSEKKFVVEGGGLTEAF